MFVPYTYEIATHSRMPLESKIQPDEYVSSKYITYIPLWIDTNKMVNQLYKG